MFDLDLESVEEASINEDAAKIIMQLEAWFESRTDKLQEIARSQPDTVKINDFENSNPDFINGFKAGLVAAVEVMRKFPVNVE
ncbi:hypothetical protein GZ77_20665 [Endozoicomonas montiporae]|uniref:Uncharacterized protein n=2 Tax=Endozoicomonas montiporae TaxID=1027273 RepID=A0A081N334_9GAMM|nr:hypothetical protein [Endozoicomonas montiporae]AMO58150.1 hypothetical protein EZMO1_4227 [Endozoicomonas montiporae CL-33]KEQ12857.1 hypothetical protein GZ77_20665 [Endozoicomonas montiporae]